MNRRTILGFTILITLSGLLASPSAHAAAPPNAPFEAAIRSACVSCALASTESPIERRLLTAEVAEYSFTVRVGAGEHDRIRLHRVVRERSPFVPRRTSRALFLAHGDALGFDAAFLSSLASPTVDDAHALPIFLAERGIDVWGIDFRWTLVPAEITDLSFLANWGIETDARDLGIGLAVARSARALGGDGFGKIHLLGWSRGGQIGYAYLNGESQLPTALRQVRGYIPTDIYLKTDVPSLRAAACLRLGLALDRVAAGEVADVSGSLLAAIGSLAKAAPADASPIVPGLSNRQAALLAGEATFSFFPPGGEVVPFYHFTGGTFDANGLPNGLVYTDESLLIEALAASAPYQPLRELVDGDATTCESSPDFTVPNVAFDDHLDDITVPILYVGAGGGFGDFGVYTTTLLGSSDVTSHIVSLVPPEARLFDIGHADIFTGTDADTLFWQPILDWVRTH